MIAAVIQLLLSLLLGWGLWRLWRYFGPEDRTIRLIVALGFLGRVAAGLALFWISWLALPFAEGLQLGDGLWFFALDAGMYLDAAGAAADGGFGAIANVPRHGPSVGFVQALALFVKLFGEVASTGLLLNLLCYLAIAALIVWWRRRVPEGRSAALIALVALTFSPGCTLWSLQPLKDSYFQFLIVAFAAAAVLWQWSWRATTATKAALIAAIVLVIVMFNISGIRWYYAFAMLGVSFAFLLVSGLTAHRRPAALVSGVVVAVLLGVAFVQGAGPYAPPAVRGLLTGNRTVEASPSPSDETLGQTVERVRTGFEVAGGATSIKAGKRLATHRDRPKKTAGKKTAETKVTEVAASRSERIVTGTVALLIPREVAVRLGLVDISGGQGLMWFADADTLFFDVAMIVTVVYVLKRWRKASLKNPIFWLLLLVAVGVGGPLIYVITNFGTLFRLRAMLFTTLVLLPLAVESGTSRQNGSGAAADSP